MERNGTSVAYNAILYAEALLLYKNVLNQKMAGDPNKDLPVFL